MLVDADVVSIHDVHQRTLVSCVILEIDFIDRFIP